MNTITIQLKRILRNKLVMAAAAVIPVVMLLFGGRSADTLPRLAVVAHEHGPLVELVLESLEQSYRVELVEADAIDERVRRGGLEYVLEIPAGFGGEIAEGRTPQVAGVALDNPYGELPVREAIEQVTRPALVLAASLDFRDEHALAAALQQVAEGPFSVRNEVLSRGGELAAAEAGGFQSSMNLFTMVMLLMGLYAGMNLVRDRQSGTLMRAAATPGGLRGYISGLLSALIAVQMLQVVVTTGAAGLVFPQIHSAVLLRSFVVMGLFAVTSLSFGVALAGVAKNLNQLGVLGSIFIFPMAMLGGAFWPVEIMPIAMRRLSPLMPTYWAAQGIELSLARAGAADFLLPGSILLMYAVLFFLLGSWKRDQVTSGIEMRQ